jgi:hypothetical protein
MWRGHERSLLCYGIDICKEWIRRGYQDTLLQWFLHQPTASFDPHPPSWLGDVAFHASHRSNLLRKDPVWYGQFEWTESADLPYVWPLSVKRPDVKRVHDE